MASEATRQRESTDNPPQIEPRRALEVVDKLRKKGKTGGAWSTFIKAGAALGVGTLGVAAGAALFPHLGSIGNILSGAGVGALKGIAGSLSGGGATRGVFTSDQV